MASLLLATDDAALHAIFSAEAGVMGFDTVWAGNGQEAIECIEAGVPDAVFLDVHLGVLSVWEVCEALRNDRHLPEMLPLYVLSDDDLSPRRLERARVSGVFPKTPRAGAIQNLLAGLLRG
jgi:CheY-like chemotaxis protein